VSEGNPGRASDPQRVEGHYTQVNIMFPASEVELPSADTFNAFPPEAQKAILVGFRAEQNGRHAWLTNQQKSDHELNLAAQRFSFISQIIGTVIGGMLVFLMIGCGTYLLSKGVSAAGVCMIIGAIGGLAGTAIYGHRAARPRENQQEKKVVAPLPPISEHR